MDSSPSVAGDDPVISSERTTIHGSIAGGIGAPVFLEAYDNQSRKRFGDLKTTRADLHGQYRFNGLAPGYYRLLSSFDFDSPDPAAMDSAGAKVVKVEEGLDLAADLDLVVVK